MLGHEIEVISGEEEAELTVASALANFDMSGKRYAMVDIGGGSVEIVTACGNHVEEFYSLDLGAVVMTDRFLTSDPIAEDELRKLQRHIRESLKRAFTGKKNFVDTLIGSGGTLTAIGGMAMQTVPLRHGEMLSRSLRFPVTLTSSSSRHCSLAF